MENLLEIEGLRSELEKTRRKLEDKEMVFDSILESMLAGYWDWHIPENYEYLSPTFKSMFGYEDHELPNSPETWQKIIHPEDLPKALEAAKRHFETRGEFPYTNEVRYIHKDGSIVWVFCKGKVIKWDEDDNPVRMVGSHIDITELRQALETANYIKQLEAKNRELAQFAYVASHDLQEPLRNLNSFADLLSQNHARQLDNEGNQWLGYILEASSRMSDLVKALLDYSRIGRDTKLTLVDCNRLIETVQEDYALKIEETETVVKKGKLPTLKGYETELRLLFQNLICNAIKFRKKNIAPQIKVTAKKRKNEWKFSIQDNGIGIPDKYSERIFIIFQRLHPRSEYEGTGIGLSHCRKIVELHGGDMWVESEFGHGSTFCFTIPVLN